MRPRSRRTTFLSIVVGAVFAALLAAPAHAGLVSWDVGTESEIEFTTQSVHLGHSYASCYQRVAAGFTAQMDATNTWVTGWRAECATIEYVNGNIRTTNDLQSTGFVGSGAPGQLVGNTQTCAAGEAVVGFVPVSGSWYDAIKPICQGFDGIVPSGTQTTLARVGGAGGSDQTPLICPSGSVVMGIKAHVDSFAPGPTIVPARVRLVCQPLVSVMAYQPDGAFGALYDDTYGDDPSLQKATGKVRPGRTLSKTLSIGNDGTTADAYAITEAAGNLKPFKVKYFKGKKDITATMVDGSYVTGSVSAGGVWNITVKITAADKAKPGKVHLLPFTITSIGDSEADEVSFEVTTK